MIIIWSNILKTGAKIFNCTHNKYKTNNKEIRELSNIKYEIKDIESMELYMEDIDIKVFPHNNSYCSFILRGYLYNKNKIPNVYIEKQNSNTIIKCKITSRLSIGENIEMVIYMPIDYEKKFDISVNAINSEIMCNEYTFNNIKFYAENGDINIDNTNGNIVELITNSGDIVISNICAKNYKGIFDSNSGEKIIKDKFNCNSSNKLICRTDSGDIIIN